MELLLYIHACLLSWTLGCNINMPLVPKLFCIKQVLAGCTFLGLSQFHTNPTSRSVGPTIHTCIILATPLVESTNNLLCTPPPPPPPPPNIQPGYGPVPPDVKARYLDKIESIGGPDPFSSDFVGDNSDK